MEYRGIDVSRYQGNIDFTKVKASGIDFVIARIGYGEFENQIDTKFERNYQEATRVGLPIGVYLYSYALSVEGARKEADVVIKWLKGRKLNLPVYYDIEDKSQINLGKETLTNMCKTFCNRIEEAGYWAGIYANKYWLTSVLNASELQDRYTIWVAQYAKENTYQGKYDMWQYTSQGRVNGIDADVDMNILYRDIFTNVEGKPVPEPAPIPSLPNLSGYQGTSIVDALKSVGYDSSFESRRTLYAEAGFMDYYVGSAIQNMNLLKRLQGNVSTEYYPVTNYKGYSIVDGLKSIGVDSSFENRKRIANKNGINNYRGTMVQNMKLVNLLKNGQLKRA